MLRFFRWMRPAPRVLAPAPTPELQRLDGPGSFAIEVVGEARYQDSFDVYFGGRTPDGLREAEVIATLHYEDANPYDPQAVCVRLAGRQVGYLRREAAVVFRQRTAHLGCSDFECQAVVSGGWDRGGGDRGHYGIRLDLP